MSGNEGEPSKRIPPSLASIDNSLSKQIADGITELEPDQSLFINDNNAHNKRKLEDIEEEATEARLRIETHENEAIEGTQRDKVNESHTVIKAAPQETESIFHTSIPSTTSSPYRSSFASATIKGGIPIHEIVNKDEDFNNFESNFSTGFSPPSMTFNYNYQHSHLPSFNPDHLIMHQNDTSIMTHTPISIIPNDYNQRSETPPIPYNYERQFLPSRTSGLLIPQIAAANSSSAPYEPLPNPQTPNHPALSPSPLSPYYPQALNDPFHNNSHTPTHYPNVFLAPTSGPSHTHAFTPPTTPAATPQIPPPVTTTANKSGTNPPSLTYVQPTQSLNKKSIFQLLHEPNELQRKSYKKENRCILPNPLIICCNPLTDYSNIGSGSVSVKLVDADGNALPSIKESSLLPVEGELTCPLSKKKKAKFSLKLVETSEGQLYRLFFTVLYKFVHKDEQIEEKIFSRPFKIKSKKKKKETKRQRKQDEMAQLQKEQSHQIQLQQQQLQLQQQQLQQQQQQLQMYATLAGVPPYYMPQQPNTQTHPQSRNNNNEVGENKKD